jgi:hypothetical protein
MSFATNAIKRNQESPVIVVKLAGATPSYFSTLPVTGLTSTYIIKNINLPDKSCEILGGGTKVSQASFKLIDILGTTAYLATSRLSTTALIGKQVVIYCGYASDSWDGETTNTNYRIIWKGYVKEYKYDAGVWDVSCEDILSKAKEKTLTLYGSTPGKDGTGKGFFKIRQQYLPKDSGYKLRTRVGFPIITQSANLLTAGDMSTWTGWTITNINSNTIVSGVGKFKVDTGTIGVVSQQVSLPVTHKSGDHYGVSVQTRCSDAATGSAFCSVNLLGVDSGGNITETSENQPRLIRNYSSDSEFGFHSNSLCVYNPNTIAIKVAIIFTTTIASEYIHLADAHLQKLNYFASIKRELVGILSVDDTNPVSGTTTGNIAVITHRVLNTRECGQPAQQKGTLVKVLSGYAGEIILRLLTTTATGANGSWDHGDSFGCGIDYTAIDTAAFTGLKSTTTLGLYSRLALVVDKDIEDVVKFIDEKILVPLGMYMFIDNVGKISVRWLPYTFTASAPLAILDTYLVSKPKVERKLDKAIGGIKYLCDYDYLSAIQTPASDDEEWNKKKNTRYKEHVTRDTEDPNYVGRWQLDERDYKISKVYQDPNRTLFTKYTSKEINIKAEVVQIPSQSELAIHDQQ